MFDLRIDRSNLPPKLENSQNMHRLAFGLQPLLDVISLQLKPDVQIRGERVQGRAHTGGDREAGLANAAERMASLLRPGEGRVCVCACDSTRASSSLRARVACTDCPERLTSPSILFHHRPELLAAPKGITLSTVRRGVRVCGETCGGADVHP